MDVNYRAQKDDKANPLYPAFLAILFVTVNIGGDVDDRKIGKIELQKTVSFIEVEPLNVYQSTYTYILLTAVIFPK